MGVLDGKRIAITGASRGLGRAFAIACADEGAQVAINGTNHDLLDEVAAAITAGRGRAVTVVGSIADDAVAERLVDACIESFGGIDVVVNNAGIVRDRTLLKMTPEEFDDVIAVNLRGTWSASRHAARAMSETGGLLLQVVSSAAIVGSVGSSNYAASKAGVLGMLYAWDLELRRLGIRTNAVWPVAQTDMTAIMFERAAVAAQAEGRPAPSPEALGFGRPDDVAKLVVALCTDRAAHVRSQVFTFSGSKLAVWQHPYEFQVRRQPTWTVDELTDAIGDVHMPVHVVDY